MASTIFQQLTRSHARLSLFVFLICLLWITIAAVTGMPIYVIVGGIVTILVITVMIVSQGHIERVEDRARKDIIVKMQSMLDSGKYSDESVKEFARKELRERGLKYRPIEARKE